MKNDKKMMAAPKDGPTTPPPRVQRELPCCVAVPRDFFEDMIESFEWLLSYRHGKSDGGSIHAWAETAKRARKYLNT